jgi:hypothetical protein
MSEEDEEEIFLDRWRRFVKLMDSFQRSDEISDDEMIRLVRTWIGPIMKIMDFTPEMVSSFLCMIAQDYEQYE